MTPYRLLVVRFAALHPLLFGQAANLQALPGGADDSGSFTLPEAEEGLTDEGLTDEASPISSRPIGAP